jgi:AcrR family transcriptional regulator
LKIGGRGAGVSIMTLYRHAECKEDLFAELSQAEWLRNYELEAYK